MSRPFWDNQPVCDASNDRIHLPDGFVWSDDIEMNEIHEFLNKHNVVPDENFTVIVNQGPGSFSGIRVSLAVAKGLEISKKVKIYGYNSVDLKIFDKENVENLINSNLIEKNLIKPIYLS